MNMNTPTIAAATLITTFALVLSGCGGGGGGGSSTESITYNVDAAYKLRIKQGQSISLRGTDTCLGTRVHVQPPATTSTTFEGAPALATTVNRTTFVKAGCPQTSGINTQTAYYSADYLPLGRSGSGEYSVFTSPPQFPVTAKVGEQGAIGTTQLYTDATHQQPLGREDISYVLEAAPVGTTGAIVNLTTRRYSTTNALQSTSQRRYSIASGIALALVAEDINGSQFTY